MIVKRHELFQNKLNVYLISMEKDKERRDAITAIIKPDIIYAVDGSELDLETLKNDNIIDSDSNLKKGEIGCYLSHYNLLKKASNNDKPVLILEDDAEIKLDTLEKIYKAIKEAPLDYDLLFLSYNYYENYDYTKINIIYGTQCYIVNNKISKDKIEKLLPIKKPFDLVVSSIFNSYIVEPKILELNSNFSEHSNTQAID